MKKSEVRISQKFRVEGQLELLPRGCMPPPTSQFTSMSVQTHVIYVVKTLKEFNKKVLSVFFGKMEVITILTYDSSESFPVRNMLSSLRDYFYRGVQRTDKRASSCGATTIT